jgi:hypothetical protein
MRRLFGIVAVIAVAVIIAVGVDRSTPRVDAQGGSRQVEVKRVNMSRGDATTQTLGVPVGISCLKVETGVECYVVSTR